MTSNHNAERRHWLCIAYAFPPINRSGTHRTLGFVRHLDQLGWDATVLTVHPDGEPTDEALIARIPRSTNVIHARWIDVVERLKRPLHIRAAGFRAASVFTSRSTPLFPLFSREDERGVPARGIEDCCSPRERITHEILPSRAQDGVVGEDRSSSRRFVEWLSHLLKTPDSRVGWLPFAARAGLSAIRRRRPDVIYSSSPYVSAHLIALALSRCKRIPWVADFRDPWGDNPFRGSGFASLDRLDDRIEGVVLRHASHVICNTPTARDALCARRPRVAGKCSVITNGFDREEFAGVKRERIVPPDRFALTHCGQFYGPRSPLPWLEALQRLRRESPGAADRVRFILVGSASYEGCALVKLADAAGVGDLVVVVGPKTHAQALGLMAGSDALALATTIGPGSELQIPNKLFEYLALRKPIIAAAASTSPAVDILREAQADAMICAPDDAVAIAGAVRRLATRTAVDAADRWGGIHLFDRKERARELSHIFDRVVKPAVPRRGPSVVPVACPT